MAKSSSKLLQSWLAEHILKADQAIVKKVPRESYDFSSQAVLISKAVNRASQDLFLTEMKLINTDYKGENKKTGVIGSGAVSGKYHADVCKSVGERGDEEAAARELYRILREFDDENVEVIYAEAFDDSGIGQAIMNRLLKAAGYKVISI